MSEVRVNNLSNENSTGGPTISGITTFSGTSYLIPPSGDTASRPESCGSGSIRFNTDSAKLEYYRGDGIGWAEFEVEDSMTITGRHLLNGGNNGSSDINVIQHIQTATLGNYVDFGDMIRAQRHASALASNTRGVFAGGYKTGSGESNVIEYVTISNVGNSIDFGDMLAKTNDWSFGTLANQIRGIYAGDAGQTNNIEFITIATTGNAQDFGDLLAGARDVVGLSSPTRGIYFGGAPANNNVIQYFTINTKGNTIDFGDLGFSSGGATYNKPSGSNGTRGLMGPGGGINAIQKITISTLGNSQDFGESSTYTGSNSSTSGSSDKLRMLIGGGQTPSILNTVEYVTIATDGNAIDFGDTATAHSGSGSCCNAHGGL